VLGEVVDFSGKVRLSRRRVDALQISWKSASGSLYVDGASRFCSQYFADSIFFIEPTRLELCMARVCLLREGVVFGGRIDRYDTDVLFELGPIFFRLHFRYFDWLCLRFYLNCIVLILVHWENATEFSEMCVISYFQKLWKMLGLGHTKWIGLRLNDLCQITLREWPFLLTINPVCFRLDLTLRNFKLALASDLSIERPLILNHFIFLSESLVVNFLLLHKLLTLWLLFTLLLTQIELL
jgi:hypothetical protein